MSLQSLAYPPHPLLLRKEPIGTNAAESVFSSGVPPTAPGRERELGRRCSLLVFLHGGPQENAISVGTGRQGVRGHDPAYSVLTLWVFPCILSLLPEVGSRMATILPSPSQTTHIPTTYLWARPLLLGQVGPEVLCSPASLTDPLCRLNQACLEVLEVLGKRTSLVSDTKLCWRWEHVKR